MMVVGYQVVRLGQDSGMMQKTPLLPLPLGLHVTG